VAANVGSIIFLMYKPQGRAHGDTLTFDSRLQRFLQVVDDNPCSLSIGFDACFVPLLLRHTDVDEHLVDSCEAGFFSIYVDERLDVSPCSFANNSDHTYNLRQTDLRAIWTTELRSYRKAVLENCRQLDCSVRAKCRGACPYYPQIQLCKTPI